jgi:hypothetical protein
MAYENCSDSYMCRHQLQAATIEQLLQITSATQQKQTGLPVLSSPDDMHAYA